MARGVCIFRICSMRMRENGSAGKYKVLLDQGIEGFWNDMNEPAIFYSEKHLQEVFEQLEEFRGINLDNEASASLNRLVGGLSNNEEDYKLFYHEHKDGRVRHDKVHNLFGYNMTRAAGEAFEELEPNKRILMFSRSSYIGMHRYGGIWTGDNLSWWSHILLNLHMMPSLNMCGFLYTGADLGGFGADDNGGTAHALAGAGNFHAADAATILPGGQDGRRFTVLPRQGASGK